MTKQNHMTRIDGEDAQALEDGEYGRVARGREPEYREEYAVQAMKVCRLGATDEELADFFEISPVTLSRWQRAHPEFRESVKRGKIVADFEVTNRLFTRACGYSCKAVKIFTHKGTVTGRVEYLKHYPPNTRACIFWLTNRRPDLWSNKVHVDVSKPAGNPNNTQGEYHLTPGDEAALRRIAEIRESLRQEQQLQEEQPDDPA